jgi:hypothetical protein
MASDGVRPTPTQLENDLACVGLTPIHKTNDGSGDDPNHPPPPPVEITPMEKSHG